MNKISKYQLILCSSFADGVDRLLTNNAINSWNYKIWIVKNAWDYDMEGEEYPEWIVEDEKSLLSLWYELVDLDLNVLNQETLESKLLELNWVFVCGWNTFWLIDCMIRSWFRDIIKKYIYNGLVYISTSAWSCVCAPDIWYVRFVDAPEVCDNRDYKWLGLVNFYIKPHFGASIYNGSAMPSNYNNVFEYIYNEWLYSVIAINDLQSICVDSDWRFLII